MGAGNTAARPSMLAEKRRKACNGKSARRAVKTKPVATHNDRAARIHRGSTEDPTRITLSGPDVPRPDVPRGDVSILDGVALRVM